jgi:hypothetical protein
MGSWTPALRADPLARHPFSLMTPLLVESFRIEGNLEVAPAKPLELKPVRRTVCFQGDDLLFLSGTVLIHNHFTKICQPARTGPVKVPVQTSGGSGQDGEDKDSATRAGETPGLFL